MAYKDPDDPRARASRRKHYNANKESYIQRAKQQTQEMRAHVDEVKSTPCTDCGESYPPWVMDLDHRDPEDKVADVSKLTSSGNWAKLLAEIEKCDVVCANCHRQRTHDRHTDNIGVRLR